MKQVKFLLLLLAVTMSSAFSSLGHVTMHAHSIHGSMSRTPISNSVCATLCRTSLLIDTNHQTGEAEEVVNDEPFYGSPDSQIRLNSDEVYSEGKSYANKVRPHPKVPIYILYGVFRV